MRNVARCWTYETGVLLDQTLAEDIPYNSYYEYYGPDFHLHINASNMENLNAPRYLEQKKAQLLQVLKELPPVPSVAYSTPIPHDARADMEDEEEDADVRDSAKAMDGRVEDQREFFADGQDQDSNGMRT